jgi:molecular chaperone GrpE
MSHKTKQGTAEAQNEVSGAAQSAETAAQAAEPPACPPEQSGDQAAAGQNPAGGQESAQNADAQDPVAQLQLQLAQVNDQYLRKAADFDNFRKRVQREKQELAEYANQNLLLDILPVLDDFERAIKSVDAAAASAARDFAGFYEGVVMIEKQLAAQLEQKWGLKRFDSAGQPFDPNRHEAIQMEKTPGIAEAVVTEDYVKGYTLKERVIRYAKVKVQVPETEAPPQP